MGNIILTSIYALLTAAAVAFAATPAVKWVANATGTIDVPKDSRRVHTRPVPLMGGLAIYLGFLVAVLIFGQLSTQYIGMIIGATVLVVLGVFDDHFDLPAWFKLIVQFIAAAVPVICGVRIELLTNPVSENPDIYLNLGIWGIPLTVIWIVGVTNAVNLIDGLDGLACSVSGIASVSLLIIAIMRGDGVVAVMVAAVAGGCFGFLPYNFNPAKILMGDTGSTFLGFLLACMSVEGMFKFSTVISLVIPFVVLGLPIFDTSMAVIRRISHGQSPMTPDRGHIHHKLLAMGLSQRQTVAVLGSIAVILGIIAVMLAANDIARLILLIIAVIAAIVLFIEMKLYRKHHKLDVNKQAEQEEKDK